MECADIKALMSEYLDDALDPRTKEALDEHISTCGSCEKELGALKAVIHELGSLKPKAAPDDFLDRLHERLERGTILERVRRKLFSPFHIKFPLELAGAALVAVLVFAVLNVQLAQRGTAPRSDVFGPAGVAESVRAKPMEQAFKKESKADAPPVPVTPSGRMPGKDAVMAGKQTTKTAPPPDSLEPKQRRSSQSADTLIELAVLIRPKDREVRIASEPASDEYAERKAPSVAEERALAPASEGLSSLKGGTTREAADTDALLVRIQGLIKDAEGQIVAVSRDERTKRLKRVTARIPTSNYSTFAEALSRLTTFQKRLPQPTNRNAETIRIGITFVYPE